MLKDKKVLFINMNAYPCIVGGLEIFNLHLIDKLSKIHKVIVFTNCSELRYNNAEVVLLKAYKFLKISQPLTILFKVLKYRKSIKLIHVSFSKAYWTHWLLFVIIKKIIGIEYFFTIHGGSMAKWKPRWPYKLFFENAKEITGVSEAIVQEYTKRSDKKIIYTPPLVPFKVVSRRNTFRAKWNVGNNDFVLLYVGSIKPIKATDSLIDALIELGEKKFEERKLKVLIAGDGIMREELEYKINSSGLSDRVKFLGNVSNDSVHELYNIADIYTICSEYEGLPISTLEAFANSIPCLTSDALALKKLSVNGENTMLFETRNSKEYAEKIETLIDNDHLRLRLSASCNNFYKLNFSYEKLVTTFNTIIES